MSLSRTRDNILDLITKYTYAYQLQHHQSSWMSWHMVDGNRDQQDGSVGVALLELFSQPS